ncbi:MAG: T9SS type A sorting domain-containing protein [Cyclobacteriaceae bacterium]
MIPGYDAHAQTIYVSPSGDDSNSGTIAEPVLTLHRARFLCAISDQETSTILLKGGERFTHHIGTVSEFDGNRVSAFIWDIDKELTISTYGAEENAILYGGFYKHNNEPVIAILIIEPSEQPVLIENITFEMWEESTLVIFETENVTARNLEVHKAGTYFFTDELNENAFAPAVIYPKNSKNVLIDGVVMTEGHNVRGTRGGLHGFYCTRLGDSEIRNVLMVNVSGSALKVRREANGRVPNNLLFDNFEAYYTGLSVTTGNPDEDQQVGFLRLSGEFYNDGTANCPSQITITNSIFHYPFCWDNEGEDCQLAEAALCSNSNENACGQNACQQDTTRVKWINNDIKMQWESTERWTGRATIPPPKPANLAIDSIADDQIRLTWDHNGDIVGRFILHRKTETTDFRAYRIIHQDQRSFLDRNVQDSTLYSYRIKACRDDQCSEFSNEATDITSGAIRVIAPNQLTAEAVEGEIIQLNWTDRSDNEDGFVVERSVASNDFEELAMLGANTTGYSDSTVLDELIYSYRVKATRNGVATAYSNVASDTAFNTPPIPVDSTVLSINSAIDKSQKPTVYPNPFDQFTNVTYQLTSPEHVTLRILDLLGREVQVLIDEYQRSGAHEITWTPQNLVTGIYLVQLTRGSQTDSLKLIYSK